MLTIVPRAGQTGSPIQPLAICLHWTAGTHETLHDSYHFCIKGDGEVVQTRSAWTKASHLWGRNTDIIGVSLCAMASGFPVTSVQIERMSRLVAELCHRFRIPLDGKYRGRELRRQGGAIVPTGQMLDYPSVTDHADYAKRDGYGDAHNDGIYYRWDIGKQKAEIMAKAKWYLSKIRYELIEEIR